MRTEIGAGVAAASRLAMLPFAALGVSASLLAPVAAQDVAVPKRPALQSNRWAEDWSVLDDPGLRIEPLDGLKYVSLSPDDPHRYVSFGAGLRERFESNDAAALGLGANHKDSYVLQRAQLHADLHLGEDLRLFTQLEDDRAWRKQKVSPADRDRIDLRLAFAEYVTVRPTGTFKARVGRQDFAFDLQRFVSSRDGPNVRQSFDAVWADWETPDWRVNGFVSRPVQYFDDHAFDDRSRGDLRFSTLRVERHVLGTNELSAYASRYERSNASYGDAAGQERRNAFDTRFAGAAQGVDWDVEAMLQTGSVGAKTIRAWAVGTRVGNTFTATGWQPRIGLQVDAASGDRRTGDGRLGTFNPLFPNGYYFTLAGYTGYSNVMHVKPSLSVKPATSLSLTLATGLLWRQTAADSVYIQSNAALPGTAGRGSLWTGRYEQFRADYVFNGHVNYALEAVHYEIGDAIRAVGGHDSSYVGLEMKAMW
jgi:hypothetical protein